MNTAAILLPLDNKVYSELAKALTMSFIDLGWNAMWLGDKDHIREYAREIDLAFVLSPFDYMDIHKLLPCATKILYQLDAMPWPTKIHLTRRKYWRWPELQELIGLYDVVMDADLGNIQEHYKWYDIKRPIFHLPIGYSPAFALEKQVKQRDIALFIGSNSDHPKYTHRNRTIRYLKERVGGRFAMVESRYGDKAKQAAKNAAVNLNIHQNNLPSFESLRVVGLLMSNKCFVLSEPCAYMEPFKHLEHLAIISHKEMPGEINYYLHTAWERERMAKNAHDFIREHYTMTQNLKAVLREF